MLYFNFALTDLVSLSLIVSHCINVLVGKKTTTVRVRNIASVTTEDTLREVFSHCKNVRMPKLPDGSSRG